MGASASLLIGTEAAPATDEASSSSIAVANINTGGRFENCFEFILRDRDWIERYERMIAVFDLEVASELGYAPETTWREVYDRFDLELDNKVFGRPNVLKGPVAAEWWNPVGPSVALYLAEWDSRHLPQPVEPEVLAQMRDLRAFDLFCQTAAAKAFSSLEEFSQFEERFSHVARSRTGGKVERQKLQVKLSRLLSPLISERVEFIAIEEAFHESAFPASAENDEEGKLIREVVETILLKEICKNEYSAIYRRDTEIVLLWRDSAAPRIIELPATANKFVIPDASKPKEGQLGLFEIPLYEDYDSGKIAETATKAMTVTRLKTLALELGDFCVFAIHAKEHKGCAELLARYLDDLSKASGRKPCVFLSDTNVEKPKDCLVFTSSLKDLGMQDASCGAPTTFKERTIFQGQPHKATIPPGLNSKIQDSFVFAPKDRVIVHSCGIAEYWLKPPPPPQLIQVDTNALKADKDAPRLPSELWPSDHLAVVAEIRFSAKSPIPFLNQKHRPKRPPAVRSDDSSLPPSAAATITEKTPSKPKEEEAAAATTKAEPTTSGTHGDDSETRNPTPQASMPDVQNRAAPSPAPAPAPSPSSIVGNKP